MTAPDSVPAQLGLCSEPARSGLGTGTVTVNCSREGGGGGEGAVKVSGGCGSEGELGGLEEGPSWEWLYGY